MIFKTCGLYKAVIKYDDFGTKVDRFEHVADIEATLTIVKASAVENGVVYHTFSSVAVTPFNDFELGERYKLVDGTDEYMVDTITPSRFHILNLTRVV